MYQSTVTDMTESAPTPLNDDFTKAIATRQSRTVPAESFLLDVAHESGDAAHDTARTTGPKSPTRFTKQ